MNPKVLIGIGALLVTLSAIGLTLALGNLASLPSTQQQLRRLVPSAEVAVSQAVAKSRDKSYIGISVCLASMVGGILVIRRGRRIKRNLD